MPNIESATRCLIGIKGSGEYIILNICLPIDVQLKFAEMDVNDTSYRLVL